MKRIIVLTLLILALSVCFAHAEGQVAEISSPEDLFLLAEDPDGDFVLTEDIYLPVEANFNWEWEPPVFRGHLDGQGHTIYNVDCTQVCPETRTVYDGNYKEYEGYFGGFFGILDGAVVENLNLVGADIAAVPAGSAEKCVFAGLMAGLMENGAVIRNCSVQGICSVTTSGHCFGAGGFAGYGSGRIENSKAFVTLICVDTDVEYKDEQFMGGAYSAGFIDLADCYVEIDGYDSDHGYVHNGGLVGMYIIYPRGTSYAGSIVNNHVEGRIRFFEDNRDRRAYCAPYIGEVLQWTYDWGGCTEDFERDEIFTYDEILQPCPHGPESYTTIVTQPDYNVQGCTKYICSECDYSYIADYTAPLKQEIKLLDEEPLQQAVEEAQQAQTKELPVVPLIGAGACVLLLIALLALRKKGKH